MAAAIGIQIGIGTEIDEKARNSTPIAIAISISTVRMCSKLEMLLVNRIWLDNVLRNSDSINLLTHTLPHTGIPQ